MSSDPTLTPVPGDRLEREFLPEPLSAPAARKFVLGLGWSDDHDLNLRLATVVSEVVTNAILHARTPFLVSVTAGEQAIRVDVSDENPDLPTRKGYDSHQPTGRGLEIVNAMADRWGVAPQSTGKTVWFEVEREGLA
jgi:anti-sigma regulatory factor (Ser/Thr protein kinase)